MTSKIQKYELYFTQFIFFIIAICSTLITLRILFELIGLSNKALDYVICLAAYGYVFIYSFLKLPTLSRKMRYYSILILPIPPLLMLFIAFVFS